MSIEFQGFSINSVVEQATEFTESIGLHRETSFGGFGFNKLVEEEIKSQIPTRGGFEGFAINEVFSPLKIEPIPTAGTLEGFSVSDITDVLTSKIKLSVDSDASFQGFMWQVPPQTVSFEGVTPIDEIIEEGTTLPNGGTETLPPSAIEAIIQSLSGSTTNAFFGGFLFTEATSGKERFIPTRVEAQNPLFDIQFGNSIALCWDHSVRDYSFDWIVRKDLEEERFDVLTDNLSFQYLTDFSQGVPPSGSMWDLAPMSAATFSRDVSGTPHTMADGAFDRQAGIVMLSDQWSESRYEYYIRSYHNDPSEPENDVLSTWKKFEPNMLHVDVVPATNNRFNKQLWNFGFRTHFAP